MPTYVIDKSVIDQINRGSIPLANLLLKILNSGQPVWMTAEAYRDVTTPDRTYKVAPVQGPDGSMQLSVRSDRVQNLRNANAEFIRQTGIRYPLQDNYVERYNQKGMLDTFNYKDMKTAALAFHLDAELITMNAEFVVAWQKVRGKVPPLLGEIRPVTGTIDYNRTRRYFILEPATIAGDQIVMVPEKPTAPSAKLVYADQAPGNPAVRIESPIDG